MAVVSDIKGNWICHRMSYQVSTGFFYGCSYKVEMRNWQRLKSVSRFAENSCGNSVEKAEVQKCGNTKSIYSFYRVCLLPACLNYRVFIPDGVI